MHIIFRKPAEIALRSLGSVEQSRTLRALDLLLSQGISEILHDPKVHKLATFSGEKLYSYRSSPKLRIVLSIHDDMLVVEDIVSHDRLERMLSHRGRA